VSGGEAAPVQDADADGDGSDGGEAPVGRLERLVRPADLDLDPVGHRLRG